MKRRTVRSARFDQARKLFLRSLSDFFRNDKPGLTPLSRSTRHYAIEQLEDRRLLAIDLSGVPTWVEQGPGTILNGNNVEGIPGRPQAGAVTALAPDPTNANRLFAASANGGVWRTTNATAANPSWTPLTDQFGTLSTSAIAFSPLDATRNTLYVGSGTTSSGFGDGGPEIGVLKTTDGGSTWSLIGQSLAGSQINQIIPTALGTPATQVVLAATSTGIYRSVDGGVTFGAAPIRAGNVIDLDDDPSNPNRFYASIQGAGNGFFISTDGGLNFNPINSNIPGAVIGAADFVEMAVHVSPGNNAVYAVTFDNQGGGVFALNAFRSTNQGTSWTAMDQPPALGIPRHTSIAADPINPNVVFISSVVGQDTAGCGRPSGRANRGDASLAAGTQWLQATCNNANGTSPHPDSRDLEFDANGNLLEANDGGVYRLTNPNVNARVWTSVNGNLRTTEFYSIAYDSLNNAIFGGTQDNGSPQQTNPGAFPGAPPASFTMTDRTGADGGIAQVDNITNAGVASIHYGSEQNLGCFTRQGFDAANNPIQNVGICSNATAIGQVVSGTGGQTLSQVETNVVGGTTIQFIQAYALNNVDPQRMIIGTNFLYESTDQGQSLTSLGGVSNAGLPAGQFRPTGVVGAVNPSVGYPAANPIAYGGRSGGVANLEVLWVGAGGNLFLRTSGTGLPTQVSNYNGAGGAGGAGVVDIVMDPADWHTAYIVDRNGSVFKAVTDNTGTNTVFTNLTGNLGSFTTDLRTIQLVRNGASDPVLLVGGQGGVYRASNPNSAPNWSDLGINLPNAIAQDLIYDATDDLLAVGTYGRGAWTIATASVVLQEQSVLTICGDEDAVNQDDTFLLIRNPGNPLLLDVYVNGTLEFSGPLAALDHINVFGVGGNDNLIVDSSNGLINLPGGIRYDGDGACPGETPAAGFNRGVDRLTLQQTGGPTRVSESVRVGATAGSGVSTIVGAGNGNTQTVYFEELEPIVSNVPAALFTIDGGVVGTLLNSDNAINYSSSDLFGNTWGKVSIDAFETIHFINKTVLTLNAENGDDTINLNNPNTPTGLTGITVDGGDPTASDTLIIVGTAGVDNVAFTPTGSSSGSLTGLGVPINFATTEHVVYDGNDLVAFDVVTINGTVTNDTLTYDANSLKGNFRAFASPDFDTNRSARIVVNGGGGGADVVNILGSAGVDTVTSAANAISINISGSLAIVTLGAGIDAVTLSTLGNNDNINLSGITVTSTVFGGDGNDTIVGSPQVDSIYAGAGNDILVGGAANDFLYGEEGNDIFGNLTLTPDGVADDAGADQAFGGEGFDNFVWEPGDGADVNNGGGDAADIFRFFGSAAANTFILRQGGTPTHFNALIGAVTIDNHGIEDVIVDGQGGGDTFTVEDLFATEVVSVNLNLGAAEAGALDPVTVNGRNVADNLVATTTVAGALSIQGLRYNVNLTNAEAEDTLVINGNDGDDQVNVALGAEAVLIITLNGNNGDDLLTGDVLAINGGAGNDRLVGGAGNQTMDGGAGDDTFVGNGGSDNVGGGAGFSIGDTILVSGTDGADVFNISLNATGQLLVNINGLVTTYASFVGGSITASGIEQIRVQGLAGNDGLTVDSTNGAVPIAINFDGGDNADTLTLTGGVATSDKYAIGPNVGEGTSTIVIGAVTQIVRFNALEPVIDLVAGPLSVVATNADNAINYTQGSVAANGLVSIDGFETIEFSNKTTLTISALSGSDTINLNNPSTPTGLTSLAVNGGDPTASDILIVNGTSAADTVVYTPTANDAGTLTGLAVPITFATTEKVTYKGAGGADSLTIAGTTANDKTTVDPNGIGIGTFASEASPAFNFDGAKNLTVNSAGGFDEVTINGTDGADTVTSNATTVTLGGTVTIGAGVDQLTINTFNDNDNIDLDLQVVGLAKFIYAGSGDDTVNLAGVIVDPADPTIFGGDGDDLINGSPNADFIYGGSGTDTIFGLGNIDYIEGGDGNDRITGGTGNDILHGGDGSDVIIWNNGDNTDVVEGGTGDDRAVVNGAGAGDTITVFADATNPSRIAFNRTNLVPFALDIADVEEFDINSGNGSDNITVGDLTTTALRQLDLDVGVEAGVADTLTINGRNIADNIQMTGVGNMMTIAGLRYDIRVINALASDNDDFAFNANAGNDEVVAADFLAAFFTSSNVAANNRFRLNGGDGNDKLSGFGLLSGQAGDDTLVGSSTIAAANGNQLLLGGDGEDTLVGGAGDDTIDGGADFDTILVNGTTGNDGIDINQTAATTLTHTVNGNVQTDTLVLGGTTRTVERVSVVANAGDDTIRVNWLDTLGTDADVNSLRVDIDGGLGNTSDRLGVIDSGTGDLILYQRGTTDDSGQMSVGPGNAEPLIANFTNIEYAQPVVGAGGDVVVFKHDPLEFNNNRLLATYLGAGDALNVDPNINPGVDPIFGLPGDQDWYRVVAERTGVLDFQVYFRQVGTLANGRPGLPNNGNLDIEVTDLAGNVVAGFGVNDNTDNERVRIPAVAGQTYYLRVFANGAAINTYNITVDNYEPPKPFDLELLDNPVGDPPPANSDTGRSQFDNITRDDTPTLVFRLDDAIFLNDLPGNNVAGSPPDEVIPIAFQAAAGTAGYRVAIFDEGDSPAPGNQTGTAPQTPLGFATFVSAGVYQFTTPVLTNGSHFLTARVQMVDPANPQQTGFGPRSQSLEIIVDTVVPPGFFGQLNLADTTQGLAAESDTGVVGQIATFADRVTSDTQPELFGRAEANAIVRLYVDTNGVAGLQSSGANADMFLGLTVANPLDGSNQFPGGQWNYTSTLDLNNPALGFTKDGLRRIYMTTEDVAGNVTADGAADLLNIFLDTAGPQVTNVQIAGSPAYNLFGLKPGNAVQGPTPAVNSLEISLRDLPNRSNVDPNFLYEAIVASIASTPGNIVVRGDHSGIIRIASITVVNDARSNGNPATAKIAINFSEPLPDDRFTLTILDSLVDPVGNNLDGESNAAEPNGGPNFPTGDGQPKTSFIARFTVDSRPEVGTVSQGLVYVDINGNFVFDPEGQDNDATNRDFVFQFGTVTDAHFAGNFNKPGAGIASGYDKLGVYGSFNGTYSFLLDTDDDGVGDFASVMPAAYQVNGIPVAGDFSAAHSGDEIGLFDGKFWYLDVNGNNQIDLGERIASNANGLPVVGDFNGDNSDDLALFNNDTNTFTFDTDRNGTVDFTWVVADDLNRFRGLKGFTDRPVAGDLNLDGVDDIGLWVKAREGVLPEKTGEFFFWVSDAKANNPAANFQAYSPAPLGNDLFAHYGSDVALPVFGNFDPPVASSVGSNSSGLTNTLLYADVNKDGLVTPIDALIVINSLQRETLTNVGTQAIRVLAANGGFLLDVSGDGAVSPIDVLQVINYLNRQPGVSGEGEAKAAAVDQAFALEGASVANAIDEVFSDLSWSEELRKRRSA